MEVYEDPDYYDVSAEVVVSNPARPERGQVSVSDDGDLTWECRYYDDCDATQIADAVAGIVTDGIGELRREAQASTSMRAACCASQGSMSGEYR